MKRFTWPLVLLGFASLLSGCDAYLRHLTATQIECSSDDVVVENDRVEAPRRVWDAHCRTGGVYQCSALRSGNSDIIHCEDASPRAIKIEQR